VYPIEKPAARPKKGCSVSDAYQVCARSPAPTDGEPTRWRISRFLGCDAAGKRATPITPSPSPPRPDILVIDDLNLGFNERVALWPEVLRADGTKGTANLPQSIVLKLSAFPRSALWAKLTEPAYADRLTVVLPVVVLRNRCAAISRALSWDRTIEEIAKEFSGGACTAELSGCRRVVVHFGPAGAACFGRSPMPAPTNDTELRQRVVLERFVYRPDSLEGMIVSRHPGIAFGATSILTAAVVKHELMPKKYPLFVAIARGLGAAQANHEIGGGSTGKFDPDAGMKTIAGLYRSSSRAKSSSKPRDPTKRYFSSFPHRLLSRPTLRDQPESESNLLQDLTGATDEYVNAKAIEVVMWGPDTALDAAPKASYGKLLTVDRDEIERINAVRNLIVAYRDEPKDKKPLAIGVFGPPGSGKSFAMKQLASELLGSSDEDILAYNLSQAKDLHELHRAFHHVRDASIRRRIPLVFWDEFDSRLEGEDLGWLKHFLEPLQDAQFRVEGDIHPFGKAIFVFAGGTRSRFEEFDLSEQDDEEAERFRMRKGPDFVSRLRGYVNIKGPNREHSDDPSYLIRRAIMFRGALQQHFPQLIDANGGSGPRISPGVINAFVRVERYLHGARSVDAVVRMSSVGARRFYGPADLPSENLLKLHVTEDFMDRVHKGELNSDTIEALAEACHEGWRAHKRSLHYRRGPTEDDAKKTHPLMIPYRRLSEADKDMNRSTARVTRAKFMELGVKIVRRSGGKPTRRPSLSKDEIEELGRIEHDRWVREKVLRGFQWARRTNKELKLHRDVVTFDALPDPDKEIDFAMTKSVIKGLWRLGYTIERDTGR